MTWTCIVWESADEEHLRDLLTFESEKEALKFMKKDSAYYNSGYYDIFEDEEEDIS
tara:strand:+ start:1817 stop:1984 length:168 start_codon:yes stop_codon:yes gene_type:complete